MELSQSYALCHDKLSNSSRQVLRSYCVQLFEGCGEIQTYCHEYDLSDQMQGNGLRSFVKIIASFFELVRKSNLNSSNLKILTSMASVLTRVLNAIKRKRSLTEPNEMFCFNEEFTNSVIEECLSVERDLEQFYRSYSNFYLTTSMRYAIAFLFPRIVLCLSRPLTCFRALGTAKYCARKFARIYAQHGNIEVLRRSWNVTEHWPHRVVLPKVIHLTRPRTVRTVFIPQANCPYQVCAKTRQLVVSAVDENDNLIGDGNASTKLIRCRYLSNQTRSQLLNQQKLVMHVHGAAFVAQSPDGHEVHLRHWARKVSCPILSVDYSLGSQNKFPTAVNEILCCYNWLLRGPESEVLEKIGFRPKRIILVGDSAGGTLILSLAAVLNDIRRKWPLNAVPMPAAIVAIYPSVTMTTYATTSRLFCSFDSILAIGVCLEVERAYVPLEYDHNSNRNESTNAKHSIQPFYRTPEAANILEQLNSTAQEPYISPIFYNHFEDLSGIKLFLIASEFDALLDDSVALAKKWPRSEVHLDIVHKMPHGFLSFVVLSPAARRANKLCLKRLIEAVNC